MSVWLVFAILAQAVAALTVFIDKYLLVAKTGIKSPSGFAFYTALLSGVVIVLVPFGVVGMPSKELLLESLLSAVAYIVALLALYNTLKVLTATNVTPIIASTSGITTGVLAVLFLAEDLPSGSLPAFLFLIVGTFLIYCFCFPKELFFSSLLAGASFGISSFASKLAFTGGHDFFTSFFWLLIANVFVASVFLLPFKVKEIFGSYKESSTGAKWLIVLSKALGGVSFLLAIVAIQQGSVTLVSALGGLQLVFLLIFVPLFAHTIPDVFKYELTRETLFLKILGTICIAIGFVFLFIQM